MLKIVDECGRSHNDPGFDRRSAVAYTGERTDRRRVRAHDLGHGHLEVVSSEVIAWQECDWSQDYLYDVLDVIAKAHEEADPAEVEAKNRERAARRARTSIRRLCKAIGADTMITLTYRENMCDITRAKANVKEWVRRVGRWWPQFRCIVGFEQQGRGAWHMHISTAGIPRQFVKGVTVVRSWDLLRALWRAVVGDVEVAGPLRLGEARKALPGGNVDVARRKRHSRKTPAQIAAYISKYITKAFAEGEKWSNRWTKFGKCEVPPPVDLGEFGSMVDGMVAAYGLMDAGQTVVSGVLDRWGQWFYLAAEGPPLR